MYSLKAKNKEKYEDFWKNGRNQERRTKKHSLRIEREEEMQGGAVEGALGCRQLASSWLYAGD